MSTEHIWDQESTHLAGLYVECPTSSHRLFQDQRVVFQELNVLPDRDLQIGKLKEIDPLDLFGDHSVCGMFAFDLRLELGRGEGGHSAACMVEDCDFSSSEQPL
jgi:hypothetical protein